MNRAAASPTAAPDLRGLDILRGLLALYVVGHHVRMLFWTDYALWTAQPHPWWANALVILGSVFRWGNEAVLLFFVLSGFFIHLRVAQQLAAGEPIKFNLRDYFNRRAHRLLPPYYFILAATLLLDAVGSWINPAFYTGVSGDKMVDSIFEGARPYSWQALIPGFLALPGSLGRQFASNGPLWSLAYEACFYLLYPAWLALRQVGRLPAYGLVWGTAAAFCFLDIFCFPALVLLYYPLWIAGAWAAERVARGQSLLTVGITICVAEFVVMRPTLQEISYHVGTLPFIFLGPWIIGLLLATANRLLKYKFWKWLEAEGVRSYSIYIAHFPAQIFLAAVLLPWNGGIRPMHGWYVIPAALFSYGFARLCFAVCEKHFLHPRLQLKPNTAAANMEHAAP